MLAAEVAYFDYPPETWHGMYEVEQIGKPEQKMRWLSRAAQWKHAVDFVRKHRESLEGTDVVIGIARGGMSFSQMLAYQLGIKHLRLIQGEFYDDNNKQLETPNWLAGLTRKHLAGFKRPCVADEITDSGISLPEGVNHVRSKAEKGARVSTAIQYVRDTSVTLPDYRGFVLPFQEWVDFEEQASTDRLEYRHRTLPEQYPNYAEDQVRYQLCAVAPMDILIAEGR